MIALRKAWAVTWLAFASAVGAEEPPANPPRLVAVPLAPVPTLENRVDDLTGRLAQVETQARNQGLFNLLNQVEALRAEVAKLRGAQEEMAYRLQQADNRQKEVLADFDTRLKEVRELANRPPPSPLVLSPPAAAAAVASASGQPAPPPPPPPSDPEAETRAYEAALNLFKSADYPAAEAAFNSFLSKHPESPLAGNACYWLGLTYFSVGDHKNAAAAQMRLLRDYPQHAKVPDAMLNLARAQIQLGETESARKMLEEVTAKYPSTRSALLAQKIMALFR